MDVGLLWYDSSPRRTLVDKLETASHRYHEKFGRLPNQCFVHPAAIPEAEAGAIACRLTDPPSTIWLIPAPNMLLHHFWLGESSQQPHE